MPGSIRPRAPSIRDVAELAGVSLGSASRVINEVPGVTPETRRRVLDAIAALGWRPNHAAQSLRRRHTRTLGCLLTDVANPLYARLFRELEERSRRAGYMMLLANGLNRAEREIDILSTFNSRHMDGVLIAPGNERDPGVLDAVRGLHMPTVILDRDLDTETDRVLFNHEPGMRRVVEHLASLGHRRIGLVVSDSSNRPIRRRVDGFLDGLVHAGLADGPDLLVRLPTTTSPAFDAVHGLLLRADRPTAVVVMGTSILSETLNAVRAIGLAIPRDLSIVALGDPLFAASHVPPIATLRIDLAQAAQQSVELLLARLNGDDGPVRTVTIEGQFLARESCGPAPARGR